MKIQHLRIENILGIKHIEITPGGTMTEIAGDNGQGKTSILEAVKAATQGGHDATLLRAGEKSGEIVLVLDDGIELRKRVTEAKSSLDLIKDGKAISRPSDTIKGLTDLLSVNPVDFLTAPKKKRVEVLLEAMPINVDLARLAEISGIPVNTDGVDGLAVVDLVHKTVFDDRAGTNRAIKEKDATINQLRLAMPEAPGGVEGDEDDLRAQLQALTETRDTEFKRIDTKLESLRTGSATLKQKLRDEAQAQINAIREKAAADISAIQEKLTADLQTEVETLNGTEGKAGKQREKTAATFTEQAQPVQAAIFAIASNRDAAAKRKVTLETLSNMEAEMFDLSKDAERQTAALDAIAAYKSDLLNSLPIPGLEVRDGEVFRHGITFDRLNTAQQVEIAIEIAALRAGDLAVCCIDRFECLSPGTFETFKERAEQLGLQLFVTRVEPGNLTIRTE
ncbi:AAA family ATPase [Tardiphaga sp. 862_B3_N1_1]|uniref:AAA family ATPase n=1 Tax=Tardiphaga sp. 862_B3_N1_1 TaxID=3240763 RepID=UPI003F8BD89B